MDVKEKAFQLYCQGLSFDEIGKEMDKGKMHVNRKTLIRWCKTEGWRARAGQVKAEVEAKNDEKAVDRMTALLAEATKIKSDVVEALKLMPKPRSTGEGVNAFVQISRLIREMAPANGIGGDAQAMFDRILDVFLKHPKVSLVVDKYRGELMEELGKVLKDQTKAEARG